MMNASDTDSEFS